MHFARAEWQALALSRQIRNGERVAIGTNLPAARAGALLAKLTHAPEAVLLLGMAEVHQLPEAVGDFQSLAGAADNAVRHHALEDFFAQAEEIDFFVVGALEIDPFGNTNLLGIGPATLDLPARYHQRTLIGPGAIGTTTMSTYAQRYALFSPEHQARVFVETLSFRSTCGWGAGGHERAQLGLPGGGPTVCITDLGVFDYPAPGHRMRFVRPFPQVSFATAQTATGFPLERPAKMQEFAPPSTLELATLRTRVDPGGHLQRL